MDYHFDHRIRLSQESEYKNLYSWSLQELSETGEQLGSAQVPWEWGLYFSASELRYNKELSITRQGGSEDILRGKDDVSSTESISAVLHSGLTSTDGYFEREVVFSMFGTKRQIKEFRLHIQPLKDGDSEETCSIWGCVSYTTEIDFRTETEEDTLQIYVGVSSERFKELCDLVNHVRPDVFFIRLGRVSGFYSEWSPSIRTNRIKVLTPGDEHNVELPDGCEVSPPRLGNVGEFVLTVGRRNVLELKREPDVWDEKDERSETGELGSREPEQKSNAILERLSRNQAAIERLKWPLWSIALLLLLLYLK